MKEKILKYTGTESLAQIIEKICFFVIGFVMSFAKIAGMFSPFCISFSMSLPKKWSMFSFLGGIFGVIGCFNSFNGEVYICALIIGMILKIFFDFKSNFWNAIFSIISFGIPSIISMLIHPVGFGTIVMIYSETILVGSFTVLFKCSLKNMNIKIRKTSDLIGLSIIVIAVLIAFCNLNFASFNFGRFLAAVLVIQAAILIGVTGGAAVGIIVTIGLALFTKDFAIIGAIVTVSGFMAGIFKPVGKAIQAAAFIGTYLLGCGFFGGLSINSFIEVFIASCVAYLVPIDIFQGIIEKNRIKNFNSNFMANDDMALKLQFTAKTLLDLQNNIQECAKKMDKMSYKDISDIYVKTANDVCKNCGLRTFCWITSYNETMRSLNKVSNMLRQNGKIVQENLPIFLKQKCCKLGSLIQSINLGYRDFVCKEQTSRRINEARSIATEQFTGMSDLLMEMSKELSDFEKIDSETTNVIKNILKDRGIEYSGVSCILDRFDHLTIDLYLDELPPKNEICSIARTISEFIGRQIELPTIIKANKSYKISFFEIASLSVDFAVMQTLPNGNSCCGDSYDFFMDGKGFAHMLLSDGMGNGSRAAVDSLMTCSTMRRLIQTGFGFNSTLKLLNLSFAIKSKEESLATIDTCTIDLYTGKTKFIKAGATSSYVIRRGKVTEFGCTSLPIGIIQGINFDTKELKLSKGDVIVMVTDGATSSGTEWISSELKLIYNQNSNEIAKTIINSAKRRSDPKHIDDITVLVSKII